MPPTNLIKGHRRAKRRKPLPELSRRPKIGVVAPGETVVVVIDPPMNNEQPMLLTPDSRDVMLTEIQPDAVHITNVNPTRIIGYALLIVPAIIANAAVLPWRKIATDIGHALTREGGMFDQLRRMFKGEDPKLPGK
jgi:hypothetical protein